MDKKIFLISLGCAKNLVDSEHILGLLEKRGYSIVSEIEEADIAIINTCGFLKDAVEECIDTIFEVAAKKEAGELERLFVAGCFVQRYGYKLRKEIPEVDGWIGTGEIDRVAEMIEKGIAGSRPFLIGRPKALLDHTAPRIQTTPFYSAYLKIAEGCSHNCAFCIIPGLRGPFRSRSPESLMAEAKEMADRGVKEVNLIAQDTTMYGRDLESGSSLEDMLENLLLIDRLEWVRILYSHPFGVSDRLLELMAAENGLVPYLDIPFQHVNTEILKAMGRPVDDRKPLEIVEKIRSMNRPISIRTTLIVGYPGETDKIFRELYDFVKTAEFDHLGTFVYSPEKGTVAARLKGAPDPEVARERRDAVMALQKSISERKNRELVNKRVPVLIEGPYAETDLLLCGRTAAMAPDVDGRVLINKGHGIVGEISRVLITEAHAYDLIGEII